MPLKLAFTVRDQAAGDPRLGALERGGCPPPPISNASFFVGKNANSRRKNRFLPMHSRALPPTAVPLACPQQQLRLPALVLKKGAACCTMCLVFGPAGHHVRADGEECGAGQGAGLHVQTLPSQVCLRTWAPGAGGQAALQRYPNPGPATPNPQTQSVCSCTGRLLSLYPPPPPQAGWRSTQCEIPAGVLRTATDRRPVTGSGY